MHQTHRNFDFLQVFAMVICLSLLLLPQISSAGGLGDLFPGDIVDKIKSTDLKDIFQPSEKNKKTPDSAPAQDNNAPAAAVEEKKAVKPVKVSTPPAVATSPVVAVSPAVAKEAEEVKAWCYKKASVRIRHDCECVARRFQDGRLAEPKTQKESLRNLIFSNNQCPNYEGIREDEYRLCISHPGLHKNTGGHDPEAFCQCLGKQMADRVIAHKGEPGTSRRSKFATLVLVQCRRPEAYK